MHYCVALIFDTVTEDPCIYRTEACKIGKCSHVPPPPHSPNTQADRKLPTDQFVVSPVLVEAQQCTTQCGVVVLPGAVGSPATSFVQLILTVEVAILVNLQDG